MITMNGQQGDVAYALGNLFKALGISSSDAQPSHPATYLMQLVSQAIDKTRELRSELSDAKLAADLAEAKVDDLQKALDEARAEIAAMVEDRRAEEERARMRLLEIVMREWLKPGGEAAPWPGVMTNMRALREAPATAVEFKAALLADLDALVALGLRGEVVP